MSLDAAEEVDDTTGVGTEAEEEVLIVRMAKGGYEVANVFKFVDKGREVG